MKKVYENFPIWIPSVSCALCLVIYALGAYIFLKLGILFAVLYLLFCVWIEFRILKGSCTHCDYYGKTCGLGRGKLCALIFKRGSPEKFAEREISWKEIVPDFLVFVLPLVGGIVYLIKDFAWVIVGLLVVLTILSLGGNAVVRGVLVCKQCKQRELGCPAEQLFSKRSSGAKQA